MFIARGLSVISTPEGGISNDLAPNGAKLLEDVAFYKYFVPSGTENTAFCAKALLGKADVETTYLSSPGCMRPATFGIQNT